MFEYLMPSLVMRAPAGSLLEQTNRLVVRRQMKYGAERACPGAFRNPHTTRGTSNSPINIPASAFPIWAYKRGLGEDTVIAPYATALAAMVDPRAAARNFARLAEMGGRGAYGWYEALTTPRRGCPKDQMSPSCAPIWRIIRA